MVYPQSWPFTRETDQFHHVGFGGTSCSDTPCCCEMMWSIHQRLVWQCLIFFFNHWMHDANGIVVNFDTLW